MKNLEQLLSEISVSDVHKSGSKKGIYIIPKECTTKQQIKKFREKTRDAVSLSFSKIVSQFKKDKSFNTAEIENFRKIYKERFILQDFSLSSVRENFSGMNAENEKNLHIAGLEIVKMYLAKDAKKVEAKK